MNYCIALIVWKDNPEKKDIVNILNKLCTMNRNPMLSKKELELYYDESIWHAWNLKHCKSWKLLLWCYSYLSFKSHSRNMCAIFLYVSILNRYWQVCWLVLRYLDTSENYLRRAFNWENMLIWLSNREYSIAFSWLLINVGGPRSLRMRPLFGNGPGW